MLTFLFEGRSSQLYTQLMPCYAVAKRKPGKNSRLYGIRTLKTSAILVQRSTNSSQLGAGR